MPSAAAPGSTLVCGARYTSNRAGPRCLSPTTSSARLGGRKRPATEYPRGPGHHCSSGRSSCPYSPKCLEKGASPKFAGRIVHELPGGASHERTRPRAGCRRSKAPYLRGVVFPDLRVMLPPGWVAIACFSARKCGISFLERTSTGSGRLVVPPSGAYWWHGRPGPAIGQRIPARRSRPQDPRPAARGSQKLLSAGQDARPRGRGGSIPRPCARAS
jgi:hypothetical protein